MLRERLTATLESAKAELVEKDSTSAALQTEIERLRAQVNTYRQKLL